MDPNSIVDYLKSVNQPSDFASRTKLATDNGITGYTGSAEQNLKLLSTLKTKAVSPSAQTIDLPEGSYSADPTTGAVTKADAPVVEPPPSIYNADEMKTAAESPTSAESISSFVKEYQEAREKIAPPLELPTAPDLVAEYTKLRSATDITSLESEISTLGKQAADIVGSRNEAQGRLEGAATTQGIYDLKTGRLNRDAQLALDTINARKATLTELYQTKLGIVDTIVNLEGKQYDMARQDYEYRYRVAKDRQDAFDASFNKAVDLLEKRETNALSEQNRVRDDARANLTVLQNSIKNSGKSWDDIDPVLKANINKLEIQSGLPVGSFETFARALPKSNLLSTVEGIDPKTNEKTISMIYADEDGNPGIIKVVKTGTYTKETSSGSGDGGGTDASILASLNASRGSDGYVNTVVYARLKDEARAKGSKAITAFEKTYPPKEFLNPADPTAQKYFATNASVQPTGDATLNELNQSKGPDGYVNTDTYLRLRDNARQNGAKALSNFEKTYPPKDYLNPNDPKAKTVLQSASQVVSSSSHTIDFTK